MGDDVAWAINVSAINSPILTPAPNVTLKHFSFQSPFGVEGWSFTKFDVTFQKFITPTGVNITYAAVFSGASYGRYSTHHGPKQDVYLLALQSGDAVLHTIELGTFVMQCAPANGGFQGAMPPILDDKGIPREYFDIIDRVTLTAQGAQNSC